MRKNRKLIESLLFLVITILLMISSTFAWLSMDADGEVSDLIMPVGKYQVDIKLLLSKNNSNFVEVDSTEDLNTMLSKIVPGDYFDFKIKLVNNSSTSVYSTIKMGQILNNNSNQDYDMRDVFFIENGFVTVKDNDIIVESLILNTDDTSNDGFDKFSINKLIDQYNYLFVANNYILPYQTTYTFEFRLVYDTNTTNVEYQLGMIDFNTITIYFNT